MSYPKFAVGEEVIVAGLTQHIYLNGVNTVVIDREIFEEVGPETPNLDPDVYYYELECADPTWVDEINLRKCPADKSFKELMQSFKSPVPA